MNLFFFLFFFKLSGPLPLTPPRVSPSLLPSERRFISCTTEIDALREKEEKSRSSEGKDRKRYIERQKNKSEV